MGSRRVDMRRTPWPAAQRLAPGDERQADSLVGHLRRVPLEVRRLRRVPPGVRRLEHCLFDRGVRTL